MWWHTYSPNTEVKIGRSEVQGYLLLRSKRESELQVLILKNVTFFYFAVSGFRIQGLLHTRQVYLPTPGNNLKIRQCYPNLKSCRMVLWHGILCCFLLPRFPARLWSRGQGAASWQPFHEREHLWSKLSVFLYPSETCLSMAVLELIL